MSITYKERKKTNKHYVLLADCKVVGVWGNLKKLCEEMKKRDADFLSYSSLSKKKKDGSPIEFKSHNDTAYKIYIELIN